MCPHCLSKRWESDPNFIAEKHDPGLLPKAEKSFRSVVTPEFVANLDEFTRYAAFSGQWFHSKRHNKPCHFTETPLGKIPGSGIRPGIATPDHALDGLLIADADNKPHAYAVDSVMFHADIKAGNYIPLSKCSEPGCDNLAFPAKGKCSIH